MVSEKLGRVGVVVGGSSGIGAATAAQMADAGYAVVSLDIQPPVDAPQDVEFKRLDVRDPAAVQRVFDDIIARFGRLDALVYAAAVLDGYAGIHETDEELLEAVLDVNVRGAVRCCQAAVSALGEGQHGRIVLFTSIAGLVAGAGGIPYTISKHAIFGLVRQLAVELGPTGITVNGIAPGSVGGTRIRSNMDAFFPGKALDPSRGLAVLPEEAVKQVYPVGRIGDPAAIVPHVMHLLSEDAWYMTGTVMTVDGGYTAR